jgi:hypothetical protein
MDVRRIAHQQQPPGAVRAGDPVVQPEPRAPEDRLDPLRPGRRPAASMSACTKAASGVSGASSTAATMRKAPFGSIGLAISRYVLKLPPVVALTPERIVRDVGETVQRYIVGAG